jgi:hypothetical protein
LFLSASVCAGFVVAGFSAGFELVFVVVVVLVFVLAVVFLFVLAGVTEFT